MKKKIGLISFILGFLFFSIKSCDQSTPKEKNSTELKVKEKAKEKAKEKINWERLKIQLKPSQQPYAQIRNKIQHEKKLTDSLSFFFEESLVNKIIPYWYGTPWDFNGHTNIPMEGKIACGYFVSTTLKHLGFNLNRYRLAQQLPIHEAKTLSLGTSLIEIKEKKFETCFEKMKNSLTNSLYFIGLDSSHVGFLLIRNSQLFFIHSNYLTPSTVIIESAETSKVLRSFSHFYLVNLSKNEKLLQAWKHKKLIPIITQ